MLYAKLTVKLVLWKFVYFKLVLWKFVYFSWEDIIYIQWNFIILINIDNIKLIVNLMLNVILRIFTFLFHNYK